MLADDIVAVTALKLLSSLVMQEPAGQRSKALPSITPNDARAIIINS